MKLIRFLIKIAKYLCILAVLVIGLIAVIYFASHLFLGGLRNALNSHPSPTRDYADAVARFEKLRLSEEKGVSPLARSIMLTHGNRTDKVIVFFHGYSSRVGRQSLRWRVVGRRRACRLDRAEPEGGVPSALDCPGPCARERSGEIPGSYRHFFDRVVAEYPSRFV